MAIRIKRSIRAAGGDYTSVSAWFEAHVRADGFTMTMTSLQAYTYSGVAVLQPNEFVSNGAGVQGEIIGTVKDGVIAIRKLSGAGYSAGDTITSSSGSLTITSNPDSLIFALELYGDWPSGLDDAIEVTLAGNQNSYVEIGVVSAARHRGMPLTTPGIFYFAPSSGPAFIRSDNSAAVISDVAAVVASGHGFDVGRGCTFINLAVYSASNSLAGYANIGQNTKLINAVNYANTAVGYQFIPGETGQHILNCADWSSLNSFGITTLIGSTNAKLINCAGMSSAGGLDSFIGSFTNPENSNNASYDSSAPGANPVFNAAPSFVNEVTHLKHISVSDTAFGGLGINLSSYGWFPFDFDYDYDVRPSGVWSIGPDHASVAGIIGVASGVLPGLVESSSVVGSVSIHGTAHGILPGLGGEVGGIIGLVNFNLGTASGWLPSLRSATQKLPVRMSGMALASVAGDGLAFGVLPGLVGGMSGAVTAAVVGNAGGVLAGMRGCIVYGKCRGWLKGLRVANPAPLALGRVSSYTVHLADQSRRPSTVITMDMDRCQNQFGAAPCAASGAPCFNALASCKYPQAYNPVANRELYCMHDTPVSVGGITRPYLKSSKVHGLEILTNESVIINAKAEFTFFDEPDGDFGVDLYRVDESNRTAPGGSEVVSVSGTYWQRWLRRNKYYKGRRVTIWQGFDVPGTSTLDDYLEEFRGVIDNVKQNSNGTVTIAVKGLLQLADQDIPRKTDGKLFISLSVGSSQIQLAPWSGLDSKVPPYKAKYTTGLIKIDAEIIAYESVMVDQATGITTLGGLGRGQHNAYGWDMEAAHEAGAEVAEVHFFAGHPMDIMVDLLRLSGVMESEINLAAFTAIKDQNLTNVHFAAVIDRRIKIKKLLAELREQTGTHIWQDEYQRITIRFTAPYYPWVRYRQITDAANIIYNSLSVNAQQDKRVSRAAVHYDYAVDEDLKEENFYQVVEYRSDDAEHEWGHGEVKARPPILSRWIWTTHGGADYAYSLAADAVELFVDGAQQVRFDLELKDMNLALGEIFEISTRALVDDYGNALPQIYMITKRERVGLGKYRYTATSTGIDGRWLLIAPDDFVDEWVSGVAEQQAYGCISNDNGTAPDGVSGYKIPRG